VLKDGYREKVKLATKMPCWKVEKPEDLDRLFDEQLQKLQDERIDFYLLHALDKDSWVKMQEMKALDWAERQIAAGRIGHLGFSFHDEFDVFQDIVDGYDGWTFCQIQFNFMDIEYQAGMKGLRYAADKGLAVVIMEPLRGGRLSMRPPDEVAELWAGAAVQRTPTEWALQWVWHQPEVSLLLSGMSAMQHVEENLVSAGRSGVGSLSEEELALIERAREIYVERAPIPCTRCMYCMPCPNGVDIPRVLQIRNEATMYDDLKGARASYGWMEKEERADNCIECGDCEEACPQNIEIIEWLKKAHELLSGQ